MMRQHRTLSAVTMLLFTFATPMVALAGTVSLLGSGSNKLAHNGTTKIDIVDPDDDNTVDTVEWGTAPVNLGDPRPNSGYNNTGGEHWGRVFDNNVGSKVCCGFNPGTTSITVTSSTTSYSLTGYTISTANDDHGRRPDGWRLFGSADGFVASNDLLDTVVEADFPDGMGFTANLQVGEVTLDAATGGYSSFRFVFDDSDAPNAFQISEIELFGTAAPVIPEPSTLLLAGLGLIGMIGGVRRRRNRC